jgi:hypothetical protein
MRLPLQITDKHIYPTPPPECFESAEMCMTTATHLILQSTAVDSCSCILQDAVAAAAAGAAVPDQHCCYCSFSSTWCCARSAQI